MPVSRFRAMPLLRSVIGLRSIDGSEADESGQKLFYNGFRFIDQTQF